MKSLSALLLSVLTLGAAAQTNVSGGIYSNTSWTLANSPYNVTADLVVFETAELSIETGVEVRMSNGVKMEVRGRLAAKGTPTQHIYMHGNALVHTPGFWKGIVFTGTSSLVGMGFQADLQYCDVSDATTCFDLDLAYRGPYHFRNCSFSYNNFINNDGGLGGMLFDSCSFTHNYYGLTHFQFGGRVSNCVFEYNEYGAAGTDTLINCRFAHNTQVALQPYGYTAACEISDNNVGVQAAFNSVNNTFINNKVKNNNIGVRINSYFNGIIRFTNNEICENNQYNIYLNTSNSANLSGNCWCSTDSATIRSMIYDGYTDISRGLVSFAPFYLNCDTPATPQYVPEVNTFNFIAGPNPVAAGGILHVQASMPVAAEQLQLSDLQGRRVGCSITPLGDNRFAISMQSVQPGIYFLGSTAPARSAATTLKILVQ